MIHCINCGSEVEEGDSFCKYCGAKLQGYDPLKDEVLDEAKETVEADEDIEELEKQLPWNNKVAIESQNFGLFSLVIGLISTRFALSTEYVLRL